jgi:hypothetical protein
MCKKENLVVYHNISNAEINFLPPQEIASVCSKPRKDEPKRQSRRRSNPNGTRQSQSSDRALPL